jgi:hypothetical protein
MGNDYSTSKQNKKEITSQVAPLLHNITSISGTTASQYHQNKWHHCFIISPELVALLLHNITSISGTTAS